jgi:hypothetical protein
MIFEMNALFIHLAIYFCIVSVLIFAVLLTKPRLWLHRMPPEVVTKVAPKTPAEKKAFLVFGIPLLLIMFGYPIGYAYITQDSLKEMIQTIFVFSAGFALWDTLVLDLIVFCTITPKAILIEGTTASDYKNKTYHLIAGAKGLIIAVISSIVLGYLLYLIK